MNLPQTPAFASARRVALYAALRDEVPSAEAFAAVVALKGEVWLPRSLRGKLEFARVDRWDALRPGAHGVMEPDASAPVAPLEAGDLALVPALAFDRAGHRLGRGAGAYDRTFPTSRPRPVLYGVVFGWQVLDALPREPHDLRVDALLTEAGLHPVADRVEC